ncbi:hypothetical protein [Dickeya dianthicola]|uniref:hypothetical protein n=1 Tax=Dickeya dianthicola TaxID=204039 RepID=UPI001866B49D|nr:hypothetical protein [Dickeya dianthicola]QOL12751.1 hypothetical protein HGI48_16660 [Dickeya dianthicola]
MTIFDSFLLAQLDVFIPVSGIALLILFCFELSVSLRLLLWRQPALAPDFFPPDPLYSTRVYPLLLFIILMPRTFSPIAGKWYCVLTSLRFQAINQ